MGQRYALHDGEDSAVAAAIKEHYSPLGPGDICPENPVSIAIALADKIDTLVGFFAIDEKPTGSKDPYALRRAALGVIRLILENKLRLPLLDVFKTVVGIYGGKVKADAAALAADLLAFFADRLKVHLKDKGVRHDLISAVLALGNEDDLVRLMARVKALKSFLDTDNGANLLIAYRRAANILSIEEKKDKKKYDGAVNPGDMGAAEADVLLKAIQTVEGTAKAALEKEDFGGAMTAMAGLRAPVDAFFDKVKVNADDAAHRAARLKLLSRICAAMNQIADFSKIEG
jgi:glycyl-tRNA synthetase beta chain